MWNVSALSRWLKAWSSPSSTEISSGVAPACSTAFHGSVSSTCSTPSVAMKAIFLPFSSSAMRNPLVCSERSGPRGWRRLFVDVGRSPPRRPVRASPYDGAALVRATRARPRSPAPEAGAPPRVPEEQRDEEENEADDHQDDSHDVDVDAASARVDAPREDGAYGH